MYARVQVLVLASSLLIAPLGLAHAGSLLPSIPLGSTSLPTIGNTSLPALGNSGPVGLGQSLSGLPSQSLSGKFTTEYHSTSNDPGRYDQRGFDLKKDFHLKKFGELFFYHKKPHKMKYRKHHPKDESPELIIVGAGSYSPICGWIYDWNLHREINTCCDPRLPDCPR